MVLSPACDKSKKRNYDWYYLEYTAIQKTESVCWRNNFFFNFNDFKFWLLKISIVDSKVEIGDNFTKWCKTLNSKANSSLYTPKIPQKCWNWLLKWAFCIFQWNCGRFPLLGFINLFFAVFTVVKQQKFKCNARGHFWSMRPNSRCFGVPRTSVTTIVGSILKFPILVVFGHPEGIG